MKSVRRAQRSFFWRRGLLPEIEGGIDSKHLSAYFIFSTLVCCLTTLHLSFKINTTDKTWKGFSLKLLLKYNIHKGKHTYSIVQLNKYLYTGHISVTNVHIKM